MPTVALTKDTFSDTVAGHDIVLVDWWAIWCGPCSTFAPVFEAASERHPDAVFGKVDTETEPELAAAARITSIPTVMAFREGVLVYSQPGALPPAAVDELLNRVRALDMDEVRRKMAAAQPSRSSRSGQSPLP